jgi:hypothetical protein
LLHCKSKNSLSAAAVALRTDDFRMLAATETVDEWSDYGI